MNEERGFSSAVSSVLYYRGHDNFKETRTGTYIYRGEPASFHEWEFRTRLRVRGKKGDGYVTEASKIIDGLRGDAFVVAQEVGLDTLWQSGSEAVVADDEDDDFGPMIPLQSGIDKLIDAMKKMVFPLTTHEAKELFRQYCKPSGSLARQKGESMTQYVSRRRRCWNLLTTLDPDIHLSDGHRADMLLDLAGIDKDQRIMVQASIGNARNYDKVADERSCQNFIEGVLQDGARHFLRKR